MSQFRGAEIYVQAKTKQRLRWLAKASLQDITPDALADNMLNRVIEQDYPQIVEMEQVHEAALAKLAESLKPREA